MPGWRPDCLRSSFYDHDKVRYRATDNTQQFSAIKDDDNRGVVVVELMKKDGFGLGLVISGGVDKGSKAQVSSLKAGGLAYRSDCIAEGDYIISVNGIKTCGMKHDEIINLLRNAGDQVLLELEYPLPEMCFTDNFSICCKQDKITLEKDASSFGFTMRGGYCEDQMKIRPLTVTHIRPGGPADREGSLKIGDRIIAINDYNVTHFTLSEALLFLQQCGSDVQFTVEYDIAVMDAVKSAKGPLLVEVDKQPGTSLGIEIITANHKGKRCLSIENIQPMSIADRCGALHLGDLILAIDGTTVEHMPIAEATQLMRNSAEDTIKLEILPYRIVQQQKSRESLDKQGGFHGSYTAMASAQSYPAIFQSTNSMAAYTGGNNVVTSASINHITDSSTLGRLNRKKNLLKLEKKPASCMSISSTTTSVMMNNQICHSETLLVNLKNLQHGVGITLASSCDLHSFPEDPPVIASIAPGSPAEMCGVIQEGDRVLRIGGLDPCERTLDESNQMLSCQRPSCQLELEFDVTESVMPSSGTFIVKLPVTVGGLGIQIKDPEVNRRNEPLVIGKVSRGSVAYRCGSLQAGDTLLAINDIRTENLTSEEAEQILRTWDDLVKLKVKREDHYADESGEECVTYTVELQRFGGPLGITISGTDSSSDPIIISDIIEGGLAQRTGAIHVGDRLLAVNGEITRGKTLTDATQMLQNAGETVNLKIARPAEICSLKGKKSQLSDRSTTPVTSVDSAMESWDSSGPDVLLSSDGKRLSSSAKHLVKPKRLGYQSQDSANFAESGGTSNGVSHHHTDFEWDELSISSQENEEPCDWLKAFKDFENQSEMLRQISASLMQKSTGSLDRRLKPSNEKLTSYKKNKNIAHSTAKDFFSDNELHTCASRHLKSSPSKLKSEDFEDHIKTIFSPTTLQLHKVCLVKESVADDFGFGLSDGMYEKGVYISGVREGGPAALAGLRQFDRVLQVNGRKTRDFDCCLTIPLITEAGNRLNMIVCRNPLANEKRLQSNDDKEKGGQHKSLDIGHPDVTSLQISGTNTPKSV